MKEDEDETRRVAALVPGTVVAHYRVVEKIGSGGMGEVYLAEDTKLKRRVALKFLSFELSSNSEARARFTREAQSVAALSHPNVVHIYEVGEHVGRPYFAMEYITGHSLHKFAHDDPQPLDRVIDLIIQVCEGLKAAHSKEIVHRDIKASNVVVDDEGRPRLVDFGLASVADDQQLTRTGSTIGTVAYMSPEQAQGKKVDHRSDLFSLGVVLYELLAGRTPFKRNSSAATLQSIVSDEAPPLTRYRGDVPDQLQQVVTKLLKKDPELRYQSADGVLPDLKALRIERTTGPVATVQSPKKRVFPIFAFFMAVVILAAIALVWKPWAARTVVATGEPMIAVLPFENLGNPEDEYFADGITDEITSRLGMIEGMGVTSSKSAIQYKNTPKSSDEIGRELGVDYLLLGTVRWAKGNDVAKVRITPQLIRVADDRQMWSSSYDRALIEVFEVQADIALQIVDQLGLTLVDHSHEELAAKPTNSSDAYDYYLRGLTSFKSESFVRHADNRVALAQMDSAIALDSNFVLAYAWKSIIHSNFGFFGLTFDGSVDYVEHRRLARWSADRALELDSDNAYARLALGHYYNWIETDYEKALTQYKIAQNELHNNPDVLTGIAMVQLRQGRFAEARQNFTRVVDLDPMISQNHFQLALVNRHMRNLQAALASYNRAIELAPNLIQNHDRKIQALIAYTGDLELVEEMLDYARSCLSPSQFAILHVNFIDLLGGNREELIGQLRAAFEDSTVVEESERLRLLIAAYRYFDENELAQKYCDSAVALMESLLKLAPDDPHVHSALGISLACIGECEQAEFHGLKGKELLSIETCHW